MKKLSVLLLTIALTALLMVGCSNDPNPLGTESVSSGTPLSMTLGVSPATFQSASFHVFVQEASSQPVNLHRVTADWEETTVTWNSFAGAFAPEIAGTFVADTIGWYSADVSSLVAGWLNGSVANLGVLLDQAEIAVPRTRYRSREYAAFEPYLEVCYSDVSGEVCEKVISMADAYIYELHPDENRGTNTSLYTGWNDETDLEKQVLVRFDLPVVEPKAELGDYVWEDLNSDGIQDADEPGIPRVIVNLYDCAGQELATMVTDGNGGYLFTGLDAGQYFVEFVLPGGFAFTIPDAGNDDAADSDADPVNGTTSCVALRTGESNRTIDAGLVVSEQTGCTRTIGYWKTHAGTKRHGVDAVTPLLPIWLGTENGDKSVEITTAREAVAVLGQKTLGRPWNGITKLYAQLLAAKLNMAAGASGDAVSGVVADADSFLAEHSWKSWNGLSWTEKKTVLEWKTTLDMYNNGKIGPGHCGCDGGGPRHK